MLDNCQRFYMIFSYRSKSDNIYENKNKAFLTLINAIYILSLILIYFNFFFFSNIYFNLVLYNLWMIIYSFWITQEKLILWFFKIHILDKNWLFQQVIIIFRRSTSKLEKKNGGHLKKKNFIFFLNGEFFQNWYACCLFKD